MLSRIEIDKFKQIQGFEQDLQAVTVLVGTNNSGKSSVLHALHSTVALAQSRLRLSGTVPMNSNDTGFTISSQDTLYLPLLDIDWLAPKGDLTQSKGPTIKFFFDDEAQSEGGISIKRGKNRNLAIKLHGREVIERIEKIGEPFSVYVPGLAGIAKSEAYTAFGSLLRIIARGDANMVLRNVLWALRQDEAQWADFLKAVKQVFPKRSLYVRFDDKSDELIAVTVTEDEMEVPLDCIGTGFLQTIQILSYIFLFKPEVTLLDEPDSHLHPSNQRALADLLWTLAVERRSQIILATHSRHMLDVFKDREQTQVLWMRKGQVQPATTGIEVLADLGAFDSAEGLLTQGIEFVVLTEDEDKKGLKRVFEANGAVKGKYQIWSYKGCTKVDTAEALGKFIKDASPHTQIIVHRDGDFMQDEDRLYWVETFKRIGLHLFLTPGTDIEGIISRLEHLKTINPGKEAEVEGAFIAAGGGLESALRQMAEKGRLDVEEKRHKRGSGSAGKAEVKAWATDLDLTDERWRHGKKFLSAVRNEFKLSTSENLKTDGTSLHLVIPELKAWISATKPAVKAEKQQPNVEKA